MTNKWGDLIKTILLLGIIVFICGSSSQIEVNASQSMQSNNINYTSSYKQSNSTDFDNELHSVCSSNKKVEGFIESIIPDRKIVMINDKKYEIDPDCKIRRNGLLVPLVSCAPIDEGIYQWARAELVEQKIVSLEVCYKVIEGQIKEVNNKKNKVHIKVYKTPDVKGGLQKFLLDKRIVQLDCSLDKETKIIAAVGCGRILHIFSLN